MPADEKLPLGIVYNPSMNRPDAALALAMLYGFQGKREARIGSVCVTGSGLDAAVYCDLVARFYNLGPVRGANDVLPAGLTADGPLPANPPMVKTAVAGAYPRTVKKVSDTSLAEAVIRNGVIYNAQAVMILSAPATSLAKSLDLQGTKDLYKERVKALIVVDSGIQQDVPAMRKVLGEFPSPIVFCGKEVGESLPWPGANIDRDFAWAEGKHPVIDAYRDYNPTPFDAPSYDIAAAFYAVRPESGLFTLSEPGTLAVDDSGRFKFIAGGTGKVRSVSFDAAKKAAILDSFVEIASAKPVPPAKRNRPPA
jgi:hypothetical protein